MEIPRNRRSIPSTARSHLSFFIQSLQRTYHSLGAQGQTEASGFLEKCLFGLGLEAVYVVDPRIYTPKSNEKSFRERWIYLYQDFVDTWFKFSRSMGF